MSTPTQPASCGSYRPGHCVHWIQARKGWEDSEHPPEKGRLLAWRADGTLVVQVGAERRELWNHQPERIGEAVARLGDTVWHQPRWGLLLIDNGGGRYNFCVAPEGVARVACPGAAPTGPPAQRLAEAGGITIPGPEALRTSRRGSEA